MRETLARERLRPEGVLLVSQALPEIEQQAKAELDAFLGGVAIQGEVEKPPTPENSEQHEESLLAAIQMAAMGDKVSEEVIETIV
jgi:hypothetical protein